MAPRWTTALCALLFSVVVGHALGDNTLNKQASGVQILFPPGHRANTIDMALADFGKPVYGATLVGQLVYPAEDAAYNPTGKPIRCPERACEYGCESFALSKPPFSVTKQAGQSVIMLLERGPRGSDTPCYFLSKAWNAQQAGADAVLVIDDTDSDLTTAVVPDEEAVAHLLQNLTVSVALISRKDGADLKALLKDQATVTLRLNWTNLEPRKAKVSWELWTTTNDQCGTLCKEQQAFLAAMKPMSRSMEQSNLTDFSPHYVVWSCPTEFRGSVECDNECIMNGTYCAPDPDGNQTAGYKGSDVLAMNVRHLCFWRLAKEAGTPWLWWDYAERASTNCSSTNQRYTVDCATEVFNAVNGPLMLAGQGKAKWDECIASGSPPPAGTLNVTTLPLFEEELNLQQGSADMAAVSILPTVRINGKQFRGTLDAMGVMRALCSAYPLGQEPSVCLDPMVSPDECNPWDVGHKNCRVGDPAAGGRTRCINTFTGYRCDCGQGWVRSTKADTNEEVCEDMNECLATNVRITDPNCGCTRCACVNLPGSYKCTGALPDKCTPEYDYGGCWKSTIEGQLYHSCQDNVVDYARMASRGTLTGKEDWFSCKCPACFVANGGTDTSPICVPQCALSQCKNGVCQAEPTPAPSGGGGGGVVPAPSSGGGSSSKSDGMSALGTMFVVLLTVGLTTGGLYAVYHYVLRQRMEGEIRDIMSQYMPLDQRGSNWRGGRGGSVLSPVREEDDEDREDAPLIGPTGGGGGFAGNNAGGGVAPALRATGRSAQGSFQPPSTEQRTAFGSLVAPKGSAASSAAPASSASSYQPPAPLDDDDPDVSGLSLGPVRGVSGGVRAAAVERQEQKKAPIGDAPLLGDGPL